MQADFVDVTSESWTLNVKAIHSPVNNLWRQAAAKVVTDGSVKSLLKSGLG